MTENMHQCVIRKLATGLNVRWCSCGFLSLDTLVTVCPGWPGNIYGTRARNIILMGHWFQGKSTQKPFHIEIQGYQGKVQSAPEAMALVTFSYFEPCLAHTRANVNLMDNSRSNTDQSVECRPYVQALSHWCHHPRVMVVEQCDSMQYLFTHRFATQFWQNTMCNSIFICTKNTNATQIFIIAMFIDFFATLLFKLPSLYSALFSMVWSPKSAVQLQAWVMQLYDTILSLFILTSSLVA